MDKLVDITSSYQVVKVTPNVHCFYNFLQRENFFFLVSVWESKGTNTLREKAKEQTLWGKKQRNKHFVWKSNNLRKKQRNKPFEWESKGANPLSEKAKEQTLWVRKQINKPFEGESKGTNTVMEKAKE